MPLDTPFKKYFQSSLFLTSSNFTDVKQNNKTGSIPELFEPRLLNMLNTSETALFSWKHRCRISENNFLPLSPKHPETLESYL